jgi:hypothetical protein
MATPDSIFTGDKGKSQRANEKDVSIKDTGKLHRGDVNLSDNNDHHTENVPDIEEILQSLALKVPQAPEVKQLQSWKQEMEWLFALGGTSKVLLVAISPDKFTIDYANAAFCRLTGVGGNHAATETGAVLTGLSLNFFDLLAELPTVDKPNLATVYRYHLLAKICQRYYKIDLTNLGIWETPALVGLKINADYQDIRLVQFWLHSQQLEVKRRDSLVDELADFGLKSMTSLERETWLRNPDNLEAITARIAIENYDISGLLLLEGFDITIQEIIRSLTLILIDNNSILQTSKLCKVGQELRKIFRARHSILLRLDREQARLWVTNDESENLQPILYSLNSLHHSCFLNAGEVNHIKIIPDLKRECATECEQNLRQLGIRSLLLIPLSVNVTTKSNTQTQMSIGIVALGSDKPNHFNSLDCQYAKQLIPSLTSALCQAVQQQFNTIRNIHPAVEWRFLQEARQRSWGVTPDAIVFEDVYPLYGISDIRGSSTERNKAIQTDLLEQFYLALAIVNTAYQEKETALGEQLKHDFLAQIEEIKGKVTVDMEVDAINYLRDNLEIYFDYFNNCGEKTKLALQAYYDSLDQDHQCVYRARNEYDRMIHEINKRLQATWEKWQEKMQEILPHYCDFEATDGIDHMIYVGKSINPSFTLFHLRSLRYEQLRAVCDCARSGFTLQGELNTQMLLTHLVLVQESPINISHNPAKEKLFEVQGTHDIRYELVKKRIDKAADKDSGERITQPGMLTIVYSTDDEWHEYEQYLHYLSREGWVEDRIESGMVEPLQGVNGLRYGRVKILPANVS